MATRGITSFQKRQKELAQHRKTARREERRLARDGGDRIPPQDQDATRPSELEDGGGRLLSRHATTAGWQ